MRNRQDSRWTLYLVCATLVVGLAFPVIAGTRLPDRLYSRGLDGSAVIVADPAGGSELAAWAYRNGSEFDIALSVRDESGFWSDPEFIGRYDGLDQIDPSLVIDIDGTAYLSFTVRSTGHILLVMRQAGEENWLGPVPVSDLAVNAGKSALAIVGDRLVVAYRTPDGTRIHDYPLIRLPKFHPRGIQEGPDAIDPLGLAKDAEDVPEVPVNPDGGIYRRGDEPLDGARGFGPRGKNRES